MLVFAGIPIAFYLVWSAMIWLPGLTRTPRYSPGDEWAHDPVWFAPNPTLLDPDTRALAAGSHLSGRQPAIGGSDRAAITSSQQAAGASPESPRSEDHDPGVAAASGVLEVLSSPGGAHGEW